MGYSSGRGNRGTRRHARGADVGSDDRRGYSSLVGGSRRDGYQAADSYGDHRDYGQPEVTASLVSMARLADTASQAGTTNRAGTASQGATRRPQGAR